MFIIITIENKTIHKNNQNKNKMETKENLNVDTIIDKLLSVKKYLTN